MRSGFLTRLGKRFGAVVNTFHLKAILGEVEGDEFADIWVVVDDEDHPAVGVFGASTRIRPPLILTKSVFTMLDFQT